MIDTVAATADAVAGRKRCRKRMEISVDEWNVWHQTANPHYAATSGPFKHAPALAEDDHTVADALVVGCLLITLLRHADRVKIGCLAQLVNVIPPIRTLDGGPAWRQTSSTRSRTPRASGAGRCCAWTRRATPTRSTAKARSRAGGDRGARRRRLTVFAVNRRGRAARVEAVVRELDGIEVAEHIVLADADPGAGNSAEAARPRRPDRWERGGGERRHTACRAAAAIMERAAWERVLT